MKTVAIIPAYNESLHIAGVVKEAKNYVDHIIVVDDGSSDSTKLRAESAGATVLSHIVNMGKGVALKTGFEAAEKLGADIIITLDGDAQHDPKEIPNLINALTINQADIVIGARQLNNKMPIIFRVGNFFLHKAFSKFFGADIHDTQSGYRALRKNTYRSVAWQTNGYSVETEMLIRARKKNLKCIEIPIKTVYLNAVKGTTIIDGMCIFINMLIWRIKWLGE